MNLNVHDRIEAIAGAIALGEATDEERREYREHISSCSHCLNALGGEHEIERVASTVGQAREAEVWEPDLRDVIGARMRRRSRVLRWGAGIAGLAVAASLGVHALFAAGVPRIAVVPAQQAADTNVTHVSLDEPSIASKPAAIAERPQRRLIVEHNVVQIARAPLSASAAIPPSKESSPPDLVSITVHPDRAAQPQRSNVPVWRRAAWHTVATTTTTSVMETAPETLTHSAESIQVAPGMTREVVPLGGETAINPQPAMIAYDEGAEGTTVFEVLVDERGMPDRCVITKPAGYPVLDDAVCKAAMRARYSPKMVDGRAVPGVYRDAFTFHMTDQSSEGISSQIPSSGKMHNATPGPGPGGGP